MDQAVQPGDWIRIYEVLALRVPMLRTLAYEGLLLGVKRWNVEGAVYLIYKLLHADGTVKELNLGCEGHKPEVDKIEYDIERVYGGA